MVRKRVLTLKNLDVQDVHKLPNSLWQL